MGLEPIKSSTPYPGCLDVKSFIGFSKTTRCVMDLRFKDKYIRFFGNCKDGRCSVRKV